MMMMYSIHTISRVFSTRQLRPGENTRRHIGARVALIAGLLCARVSADPEDGQSDHTKLGALATAGAAATLGTGVVLAATGATPFQRTSTEALAAWEDAKTNLLAENKIKDWNLLNPDQLEGAETTISGGKMTYTIEGDADMLEALQDKADTAYETAVNDAAEKATKLADPANATYEAAQQTHKAAEQTVLLKEALTPEELRSILDAHADVPLNSDQLEALQSEVTNEQLANVTFIEEQLTDLELTTELGLDDLNDLSADGIGGLAPEDLTKLRGIVSNEQLGSVEFTKEQLGDIELTTELGLDDLNALDADGFEALDPADLTKLRGILSNEHLEGFTFSQEQLGDIELTTELDFTSINDLGADGIGDLAADDLTALRGILSPDQLKNINLNDDQLEALRSEVTGEQLKGLDLDLNELKALDPKNLELTQDEIAELNNFLTKEATTTDFQATVEAAQENLAQALEEKTPLDAAKTEATDAQTALNDAKKALNDAETEATDAQNDLTNKQDTFDKGPDDMTVEDVSVMETALETAKETAKVKQDALAEAQMEYDALNDVTLTHKASNLAELQTSVGDNVEIMGDKIEITQDISDLDWSAFDLDVVNLTLPIIFGACFVLFILAMALFMGKSNGFARIFAVIAVAGGSAVGVAGLGMYNSAAAESMLYDADGVIGLTDTPAFGMLIGAGCAALVGIFMIMWMGLCTSKPKPAPYGYLG